MAPMSHARGAAFLLGGTYAATMFSSYMSSPWTIRNVGADKEHAATAKVLIGASFAVGAGAAVIAAIVDQSMWSIYGAAFAGSTFLAAYWWALSGAQKKGYTGLNQGMSNRG